MSIFMLLMVEKIKSLSVLTMILIVFWCWFADAGNQPSEITEKQCILNEGAEVLWDLRRNRWMCCIPEGTDLETCIPIVDKDPLPPTSTKPLPPEGSKKTIDP
jgi:hypothetical protein